MATERDQDFFIRRIEGMLKAASDVNMDEKSRERILAQVDAICFQHRIDQAKLFVKNGATQREVLVREYERPSADGFSGHFLGLRSNIFQHYGSRTHLSWRSTTVVGYEDDIRMAEMLWANVFLHFTRTIFPKWEDAKSFDANVYDIKRSGYSWPQVREMGMAKDAGDARGKLTLKNAGSKLRIAYRREAERRGETVAPGKQQPIVPSKWRNSFADAYYSRLLQRLANMKKASEEAAGKAGVLALISEQDRVDQHFYSLFPDLTPAAMQRQREESDAAEKARREALTDKEREKEDREAQRRWNRIQKRPSRFDGAGWDAGFRAADKADLGTNGISETGERKSLT